MSPKIRVFVKATRSFIGDTFFGSGAERTPIFTGTDVIPMMLLRMCLQLSRRVISMVTRLPSDRVHLSTRMRLPMEMVLVNMFLQRRVLPKRLHAGRKVRAAKLLPAFMCLVVSAKPSRRQEAFRTASPVAHVIADIGVRAFDVVREVGLAEEVLITRWMGTLERAGVCVRSYVLLESCRTVECFAAVRVGAETGLASGG